MEDILFTCDFKDIVNCDFHIDIIDTDAEAVTTHAEAVVVQEVIISRKEIEKTDAIFSGSLNITLLATRNYHFYNLYTADAYRFRIILYKERKLIWSGFIDSEIYEEPYNYEKNYPVSITATDLGGLKRIKLPQNKTVSIFDFIKFSLSECHLLFNNLYIVDNISINEILEYRYVEHMYINMTNFAEKDAFESLEGVLKSLSLKLYYVDGNVYIVDFDNLFNPTCMYNRYNNLFQYTDYMVINHQLPTIKLLNNDAIISILPTYQNAELVYKINTESSLMTVEVGKKWEEPSSYSRTFYLDDEEKILSFKIQSYKTSNSDTMKIVKNLEWVKMDPGYSDANVNGAIAHWYDKNIGDTVILSLKKAYVFPDENLRLRIQMQILLSVDENPFEPKSDEQNANLKNHSNIIYFFGDIFLYDENNEISHYYNSEEFTWKVATLPMPNNKYIFAYYEENRTNQTPAGKLMTNGVYISKNNREPLPSLAFRNIGKGDLIPLPPTQGMLEIRVSSGFHCYDYKEAINQQYLDFKWLIYNKLQINIEDKVTGKAMNSDDITYSCRINNKAKDTYKDILIIGSNIDKNPLSKSSIYKMSGGKYMIETSFKKDGKVQPLESYQIASIFSNFATKQIKIDTSIIPIDGLGYIEENGKKMIKIASYYNLILNQEKVALAEFKKTDYLVEYE